jgi:drug/metabolite transporter (DMT)-like permease
MPAVFVLIWSTGFIVARYGMPHAPPMTFLAWRYALSIACLGAWIALARVAWPRGAAQWGHLAVTGVLMHAGYLGGVWAAVKAGMGAGLSALIVGLQPVLTALWLAGTGGRVTGRQWLGLALGFVGLVLVVWHKLGAGSPGDTATAENLAYAIAALLAITSGTLYQKRFLAPCDVRTANTVQLAAALLVTLPLAWAEAEPMRWNAESAGAMAWSVLGLTLGGQLVAVPAHPARRGGVRLQPDVSGATMHRCPGLAVVWRADHADHADRHGAHRCRGGVGGARRPRILTVRFGGGHAHVCTPSHRRHCGRRHRRRSHARRAARAAGRGRALRHRAGVRSFRLCLLALLRAPRADAAQRLAGAYRRTRRDLLRRRRLARKDPGPRVAVGLAAAVSAHLRPVRQPAPSAADARPPFAPGAARRQCARAG